MNSDSAFSLFLEDWDWDSSLKEVSADFSRLEEYLPYTLLDDTFTESLECMQDIWKIVENKLSNREKQCMILVYREGVSTRNASRLLGIQRGSLKRYIKRAIEKIRAELELAAPKGE